MCHAVKSRTFETLTRVVVTLFIVGTIGTGVAMAQNANTQIAELYQLQAAFHEATSGAGVSAAAKLDHLKDMLALWTDNGILIAGSVTYSGKGEPETASCAPGSLTICDFFANHAGPFVLGRNWGLAGANLQDSFQVHGDNADIYFECYYLDVPTGVYEGSKSFGLAGDPTTGQARKVGGQWLLSYSVLGGPPLSSSY